MRLYFDAAYLVKCYFEEPGSAQVRALAESHRAGLACSMHGRSEFWAFVMRCVREGRESAKTASAILRQMEADEEAGVLHWFPVTEGVVGTTCGLLEKNAGKRGVVLRAADALHLSCARLNGFTKIHSNDKHLLAAAAVFGLEGVDVTGR